MHPLTLDCPKPLLPVGARPLVEHQIDRVVAAGADRVVLSTGYRPDDFTDLVSTIRAKGMDLTTVSEPTPQGTGGGLREALRALPGAEIVIVLNGDLLTGHDLARQISKLISSSDEVLSCLHVRDVPDPERYGSVLVDEQGRITRFVEKSPTAPSRSVNAGTYVVRRALLDRLPAEGPVSLERDVFPRLAAGSRMVAHPEEAYFLDVGSPAALLAANRDLVLGRLPGSSPAEGGDDRLILPGATVDPTAAVGDGSVVHTGAVIGARTVVTGSLVLPGARVEADSHVSATVVGRRAVVGSGSRLTRCALGSGVEIRGERLADAQRPACVVHEPGVVCGHEHRDHPGP